MVCLFLTDSPDAPVVSSIDAPEKAKRFPSKTFQLAFSSGR